MNAFSDALQQLAVAGLASPRMVTLAITNRCNLSCHHCWPASGPDEQTVVPKSQVLRIIDDVAALGTENIVITGGEPLTHPDWFELLAFACSRPGVGEVRLQTNATPITPVHVEALLSLKDQGLFIQTSLDGATRKTHDRVRGPGSFDRTMEGLRWLQKGGLAGRVCINFTEMRHNFEEIPDLMQRVEEMGVFRFVTSTLVPSGRAAQPGGLVPPSPAQYEDLLARYQADKAFSDRYHRIGNIAALEWFRSATDSADTCCAFIETPYITAAGKLYPCVMLQADDVAATGVFERPLTAAIAEKIESWARLKKIGQDRLTRLANCKPCPYYRSCGGGCMGRAHSAYGDFFAIEDRCQLRKAVYRYRSQDRR